MDAALAVEVLVYGTKCDSKECEEMAMVVVPPADSRSAQGSVIELLIPKLKPLRVRVLFDGRVHCQASGIATSKAKIRESSKHVIIELVERKLDYASPTSKHQHEEFRGSKPLDVLLPLWGPIGDLQLRACPSCSGRIGARLWPCAALIVGWVRRYFAEPPVADLSPLGTVAGNVQQAHRPWRSVEIGAGTGACTLALAAHATNWKTSASTVLQAVATDGDSRVFPLLDRNCLDFMRRAKFDYIAGTVSNSTRISVDSALLQVENGFCARTFHEKHGGPYDVVIVSDVVYEHRLLCPLLDAVGKLLSATGTESVPTLGLALISLELRPCGVDLRTALPKEAFARGWQVCADITDEVRFFAPLSPEVLAVPPLESRHRLFLLSPTSFPGVPNPTLRYEAQSCRQPWQEHGASTWYSQSSAFWEKKHASLNGVMDGHEDTSDIDMRESGTFLDRFLRERCSFGDGRAVDCGAGIGRVTEHVLASRFLRVDLVEPTSHLMSEAKRRCANRPWMGEFFEVSLQNLELLPEMYDLIWIQWVLLYLTDSDLKAFLQRVVKSVSRPGESSSGLIVIKENVVLGKSRGVVDERDSSLTRSDVHFQKLFKDAGLEVLRAKAQEQWPSNLLPVMMYALAVPIAK